MRRAILSGTSALALAIVPASAQVIGSGVSGGDQTGMITPILAKAGSTGVEPSNSVASFASIIGGEANSTFSTTRTVRTVPFPINGTFSRMKAFFPQALSQGSYNVTLNVNNSVAPFTCTIDTTHQTCTDDVSTVSVTPGQLVAINVVPTGTPTAQTGTVQIGFEFVSSAPNESFVCGIAAASPSNSAQNWNMFGGVIGWQTSDILASSVVPVAGAVDHFYLSLVTTIAAGTWDYSVYKNGSASVVDTGAISSGTTGQDLTHSVALAALDTLSVSATPASTPTASVASFCARWMPTTKGKALLMSAATTVPPVTASAVRYGNLSGTSGTDSTQTNPNNIIPDFSTSFTLSNFVAAESTAPGGAATRAVDVISGTPGGTINTLCGFSATILNASTLTIGGVANTPAIQDNSTNCAQTGGNSASIRTTNSATANAAVTWFKYSATATAK